MSYYYWASPGPRQRPPKRGKFRIEFADDTISHIDLCPSVGKVAASDSADLPRPDGYRHKPPELGFAF